MSIVMTRPGSGVTAIHAADLTAFRAAVDDSFVPLHVTAADPDRFRGSISAASADGIHVSTFVASPHVVYVRLDLVEA